MIPSGQELVDYISQIDGSQPEAYLVIALLMFLNMVILEPPSEFIGIAIGIAVYLSDLNWLLAISVAASVNLVGTMAWYSFGRLRSGKSLRVKNSGGWLARLSRTLEDIEELYRIDGKALVFLLRFVPLIRALCSYPAGKIKMPIRTFIVCSLPGLFLWMVIWSVLGYFLGQVAVKYHTYVSIALGIAAYIVIKLSLKRLGKRLVKKRS